MKARLQKTLSHFLSSLQQRTSQAAKAPLRDWQRMRTATFFAACLAVSFLCMSCGKYGPPVRSRPPSDPVVVKPQSPSAPAPEVHETPHAKTPSVEPAAPEPKNDSQVEQDARKAQE